MKCLETPHRAYRPVGYGMIGWPGCLIVSEGEQSPAPRITPFPTGRIMTARFPGISCLDFDELSRVATFISSLRDKGKSPGLCSVAPSKQNLHRPGLQSYQNVLSQLTTNHQSPITNHQSPITNHQSPITPTPCRLTCSLIQRFDPAGSDNQ
jgi:hypothetical protein